MPREQQIPGLPQDIAQRIDGIVKSVRRIMRKDMGTSSDLDRLPLLTWLLFIKLLDDKEKVLEAEAKISRKSQPHIPTIPSPYRWGDWAADQHGMTGNDLLSFIKGEEVSLPNGKVGKGLLTYLSQISNGGSAARRRRVVASVFRNVSCPMESGYLLRDVLNKVDQLHFDDSKELCILGHIYERMLLEMRNAAGKNGEFYTPRPVIQFMTKVMNPRLGEIVLDPACGTGGFLVEAYQHLEQQCQSVEDRKILRSRSIRGGEPKPLPYLLCQMNLLLHGIDSPDIDPENSLRFKLNSIGQKERVDVVLANPPFGGEEEVGIQSNFPHDMRTSETALLFMQLIMRRIKCIAPDSTRGGRAALIVPNSVLFSIGVGERIRRQLLEEFNLHTIVRLPLGVFAPYATIETNLLFFDRSSACTKEIWFYEHPLPDGLKNYTKTKPIKFDDFSSCIAWWKNRKQGPHAWKMCAKDVLNSENINLDIPNPRTRSVREIRLPTQVISDILKKEEQATQQLSRIKSFVGKQGAASWSRVPLREVMSERKESPNERDLVAGRISIVQKISYKDGSIHLVQRPTRTQMILVYPGDLLLSGLAAAKGAFAIYGADKKLPVAATIHYSAYKVDEKRGDIEYLLWVLRSSGFRELLLKTTNRGIKAEVKAKQLLGLDIPLPPLEKQREIVARIRDIHKTKTLQAEVVSGLDSLFESVVDHVWTSSA